MSWPVVHQVRTISGSPKFCGRRWRASSSRNPGRRRRPEAPRLRTKTGTGKITDCDETSKSTNTGPRSTARFNKIFFTSICQGLCSSVGRVMDWWVRGQRIEFSTSEIFSIYSNEELNQNVHNKSNNNSSNSLVFGSWPQRKMIAQNPTCKIFWTMNRLEHSKRRSCNFSAADNCNNSGPLALISLIRLFSQFALLCFRLIGIIGWIFIALQKLSAADKLWSLSKRS